MEVKHKEEGTRGEFYIEQDGNVIAELTYLLSDETTMVATHTGTHPRMRGQGIAMKLVEAAVEYAREKGLKISPMCSYVAWAFNQRKDLSDVAK
jgi:hypothetical protein